MFARVPINYKAHAIPFYWAIGLATHCRMLARCLGVQFTLASRLGVVVFVSCWRVVLPLAGSLAAQHNKLAALTFAAAVAPPPMGAAVGP